MGSEPEESQPKEPVHNGSAAVLGQLAAQQPSGSSLLTPCVMHVGAMRNGQTVKQQQHPSHPWPLLSSCVCDVVE
jgi:hypothetical protein